MALSDLEAQQATKVLLFEWEMLNATCKTLNDKSLFAALDKIPGAATATMEAFATHARNLIYFFYEPPAGKSGRPKDPHPDDVRAPDVVPRWQEQQTPVAAAAWLQASKQVSHITKQRLPLPTAGDKWDYEAIKNDIAAMVAKFIPLVGDLRLDPSWLPYKAASAPVPARYVQIALTGPQLVPTSNTAAFPYRT